MYRKAVWLLCLMSLGVVGGCPITQSQDTPVPHKYEVNQLTDKGYYIYVPSTYSRSKKYPLVITLHGTWPWDVAKFQIMEWKALAEQKQFIVVAPKLHSPNVWREGLDKDEQYILAIVREVTSRYNIDKKKILLTGFSSGGYPMYYTGLRHPDKFDMLVARACNADSRLFMQIDVADNARRIPVVIFVGKDDHGLQKSSWIALRWLREHGWNKKNSYRKVYRGGHLRRPETTYSLWMHGP
ncbi:MAG: prolyl oligopeptidase family serine peptidase [Phycisphaerae bacterium]|nr:prolyl oligopeptidase family serine peptidase [Phycisphaerae bacterium]